MDSDKMVSIDNTDNNCNETVVLILVVVVAVDVLVGVIHLIYFSEFECVLQMKTRNLRWQLWSLGIWTLQDYKMLSVHELER